MKRMILVLSTLLSLYGAGAQGLSQQDLSQYEKKEFARHGATLLYRVLYPLNYDKQKKYPLVMFLHGAGERGNNNESQLQHGGELFLRDSIRKNYPAIVIFPQCPKDSGWAYVEFKFDQATNKVLFTFPFREEPTVAGGLVKELMDSLVQNGRVDNKRLYIAGLSMGGFGTFNMLARYPDYFAAAIPICGGGDTALAKRFAQNLPLWVFHGDADPIVNVEYSRSYVRALHALGATPRYTEYPGVGHNSWDNAFVEKDLLHWLFFNKKN